MTGLSRVSPNLVEAIRGSKGHPPHLVSILRGVVEDVTEVGRFFGLVEREYGQRTAVEVFRASRSTELPVHVIHRGEGWRGRDEFRPSAVVNRLFRLAEEHGDVEALLQLATTYPGVAADRKGMTSAFRACSRAQPIRKFVSQAHVSNILEVMEQSLEPVRLEILNLMLLTAQSSEAFKEILRILSERGFTPSQNTLLAMTKRYRQDRDVEGLREVVQLARKHSLMTRKVVQKLMSAFGSCEELQDAKILGQEFRKIGLPHHAIEGEFFAYAKSSQLQLAIQAFESLERPTQSHFLTLMRALKVSKRPREVMEVFQAMRQMGFDNTLAAFEILVSTLFEMRHLDGIKAVMEEMKERQIPASPLVYRLAMRAYADGGDWKAASDLLEEAQKKSDRPVGGLLDVTIRSYVRHGRLKQAMRVLKRLVDFGFRLPAQTLDMLLMEFSKVGNRQQFAKLDVLMQKQGIHRTIWTYIAFMRLDLVEGNNLAVVQLFGKLSSSGMELSTASYNCLLEALRNMNQCSQAVSAFEEMKLKGISPDSRSFSLLLESATDSGIEDDQVRDVLLQMHREAIPLQKSAFVALIRALSSARKTDSIETVLRHMLSMDYSVNSEVLEAVMQPLREAGRPDLARDMFHRSKKHSLANYAELIRASSASRSRSILNEAKKQGHDHPQLCIAAMRNLVDSGDVDAAVELFEHVPKDPKFAEECGTAMIVLADALPGEWIESRLNSSHFLRQQGQSWLATVRAYCRLDNIGGARLVLRRALRYGRSTLPLRELFHAIMDPLAKQGDYNAVRDLLQSMRRKKVQTNARTLQLLIESAGRGGRADIVKNLSSDAERRMLLGNNIELKQTIERAKAMCGLDDTTT